MNSNDLVNQAVSGATNSGSGAGAGNAALSDAFDLAIGQAQQTLSITTKKGSDLYALKQRPQ